MTRTTPTLDDVLLDFVLVGLPKDCAMVGGKIIVPERKRQFTEDRNKQYAEAKDRLNRLILTERRKELASWTGCCDSCVTDRIAALTAQLNKEEK